MAYPTTGYSLIFIMSNETHQTIAFRLFSAPLSASPVPEHHAELWKAIAPGFKTNRTFSFASCCCTFYDKRKRATGDQALDHLDSKTLFEVLGKRRFDSDVDFSSAISTLEKTLKDPNLEVAFNRDHASTQNTIKLSLLEKRVKELEETSKSKIDTLDLRIVSLEKENEEIRVLFEEEKAYRMAVTQICKTLVQSSGKVCIIYKVSPLPDLLPN